MKKYWHSPKYKRYMQRHARRSLAAQLRHKEFGRQRRRQEQGIPKAVLKLRNEHLHTRGAYYIVRAPDHLNFVGNPEEMCRFIASLKNCLDARRPVWVEMQHVKELDYDAITVLLSVMIRFKSQDVRFNGDHPRDKDARQLLKESGFFDHLYKGFQQSETYQLAGHSSIVTHAMRVVDSTLGAELITLASETIWGEKKRCPGVQRTLVELMLNTNNHASPEQEGEKHWWLSVKHLKEERRVAFSFVDYGVGVFTSLKEKPSGSMYYGILQIIYDGIQVLTPLFGPNNALALEKIFNGELHRTVTGQTFRGKGLPGIYQAFEDNRISNLAMITNDVFFDSRTNTYKLLKTPFEGTFVYWELGVDNHNLPYVVS